MYYYDNRPHPYINIPPGARPPVNSPPEAYAPYAFEDLPPGFVPHPWEMNVLSSSSAHSPRYFPYPDSAFDSPSRPHSRTRSVFETPSEYLAFPEAPLYRTSSQSQRVIPSPSHQSLQRNSRSEAYIPRPISPSDYSPPSPVHGGSPASSFQSLEEPEQTESIATPQQTPLEELNPEEALARFQAGDLPDRDEEWYKMVPEGAQDALGKKEVQRQSVLFEVFKSERDYVHDMQLIEEVFVNPLRNASPPVISPERLPGFLSEVFWNLRDILVHHQRMLGELFVRQRDQHPLIQSVTDIILDTSLLWRNEYESYIKHYPLAEARHRAELKRSESYREFIQKCSHDPRIRKRDLITFLSRPVTRLPRLSLVLEHIHKLTDSDHPDLESLPLLLVILSDFIKSTQPGILAAESKVKFWDLGESLVFQNGEILDMDFYDESRTLVYSGPLARRQRSETDWHGWNDYFVALLDNFLLLTREVSGSSEVVKRHVSSRPLPLEYLRLGAFDGASETRKVAADDGRLLESLRFKTKPLFPFTVYHAASKSSRRYTLFAASEALRQKWKEALENAIAVYRARQEANMYFLTQSLDDYCFRSPGTQVSYSSGARFSGKVTSAVPFSSGNRRYIAVGCSAGVFVAVRGDPKFHRVLPFSNPPTMLALQDFNKLVVQHEACLFGYSLDIMARVVQSSSPPKSLEASIEKIAGQEGSVLFARAGRVGNRYLLIYVLKKLLQVTVHTMEVVNPSGHISPSTSRGTKCSLSFRPFNGPFYIPKEVHDVTPLIKTIAVTTEKGIIIIDPANLHKSVVTIVPDFSNASNNAPMANLKTRCDNASPLGLVRCDAEELLVIYDTMGCYVTKHGVPSRSSGYMRWEIKATSFAHRGTNVLLFSPEFIEVRNVKNGRIVQVIEGQDIRLLHSGPAGSNGDTILFAKRGTKDDKEGLSDNINELVETSELARTPSTSGGPAGNLWDEWDM